MADHEEAYREIGISDCRFEIYMKFYRVFIYHSFLVSCITDVKAEAFTLLKLEAEAKARLFVQNQLLLVLLARAGYRPT